MWGKSISHQVKRYLITVEVKVTFRMNKKLKLKKNKDLWICANFEPKYKKNKWCSMNITKYMYLNAEKSVSKPSAHDYQNHQFAMTFQCLVTKQIYYYKMDWYMYNHERNDEGRELTSGMCYTQLHKHLPFILQVGKPKKTSNYKKGNWHSKHKYELQSLLEMLKNAY